MNKPNCIKCKVQIDVSNAKNCPQCGSPITDNTVSQSTEQSSSETNQPTGFSFQKFTSSLSGENNWCHDVKNQ